jgi:hypothetical protein
MASVYVAPLAKFVESSLLPPPHAAAPTPRTQTAARRLKRVIAGSLQRVSDLRIVVANEKHPLLWWRGPKPHCTFGVARTPMCM